MQRLESGKTFFAPLDPPDGRRRWFLLKGWEREGGVRATYFTPSSRWVAKEGVDVDQEKVNNKASAARFGSFGNRTG